MVETAGLHCHYTLGAGLQCRACMVLLCVNEQRTGWHGAAVRYKDKGVAVWCLWCYAPRRLGLVCSCTTITRSCTHADLLMQLGLTSRLAELQSTLRRTRPATTWPATSSTAPLHRQPMKHLKHSHVKCTISLIETTLLSAWSESSAVKPTWSSRKAHACVRIAHRAVRPPAAGAALATETQETIRREGLPAAPS